ncbi:MAG TPA: ABC transporter permease [Bryobacteraceae bacterium]|nr:ABC transporter permease [Bryobacteraceae bacterium]
MRNFFADLRHSVRVLVGSPGFTIVAVLALALGIGANTAIFSVIDRVLLRPLPFRDSERIMRVQRHFPQGEGTSASIPKFMAWRKCAAFQSLAAYDFISVSMNLGSGDRPNPVNALHVSSGFFDVFGVPPLFGRTFAPQEDLPNAGKFAVLTYRVWKDRFAASRDLIGGTILLNSERYVVLGVLPEDYQPDPVTDIYLPHQLDPNSTNQGHMLLVAGRLKSGATPQSAMAELKVVAEQFRAANPDFMNKDETVGVIPLRVAIGGDVRLALLILGGAVCFVLLMACANVANLLLARAAGRQKEIAIRTALGAGRGRIVRQLLTESMMLALAGGVAGLFVGGLGIRALLAFSPGDIPRINDPEHPVASMGLLDVRVLAFLFGVTLLTGLLFGLLPAIRVSLLDVNSVLKESGGRSGSGLRHNRIRGVLVVSEIALAVVLVAGAALMIRTLAGLKSVKPGLDPTNLLTLKTPTSGRRYETTEQMETMIRQARERIEGLPGVEYAAATLTVPMEGSEVDLPFSIAGRVPKDGKWEGDEQWRFVSPHYFEALRIPLLRGRSFDARDTSKSDRVAIINEAFAKKYWPSGDPIGQRILLGKGLGPDFEEPERQIVGIVGSVTEVGLDNGMVPVMYVPQSQVQPGLTKLAHDLLPLSWLIRTKSDPLAAGAGVRREFEAIDTQLAPAKMQTMEQVISDSTTRQNFNMLLLTVFAVAALLLAAVGIYGLMSYTVEQRTQELGIRMALGASQGQMMTMILGQAMRLAGIGVVLGLAGAYGLTRVLAGLVFGVKTTDPWTFGAVAAILTAVALVAGLLPARRATRVDPILALRCE